MIKNSKIFHELDRSDRQLHMGEEYTKHLIRFAFWWKQNNCQKREKLMFNWMCMLIFISSYDIKVKNDIKMFNLRDKIDKCSDFL